MSHGEAFRFPVIVRLNVGVSQIIELYMYVVAL
jgi:hypothetical protein